MSVALELDNPAVIVLPLSQDPDQASPGMPNAAVYDWHENSYFDKDVPLEFQGAIAEPLKDEARKGISLATTFRDLDNGKWALQDFLSPRQEEQDLYPGEVEMKAMRYGGLAFRAIAAVLVLFVLWGAFRLVQIVRDPAWHSKPVSSISGGAELLRKKITSYEQWNSFLADRSKAWVSMELFSRMFPNPKAIVITQANHTVRPEAARDQKKVSLLKDWTINGFANDAALDHLTAINTREGIRNVFRNVYELTADESMNPDVPTRNLVVNLLASENKRFDPDKGTTAESQFPFIFSLTISQRIESNDPLAIPTTVAP